MCIWDGNCDICAFGRCNFATVTENFQYNFFIRLHNRISKNVDCIKINNLHFQPFWANIRTFGTVKVHFAVDTGSGVPSAVRDICVVCNDFQFICSGNNFSGDVNKKVCVSVRMFGNLSAV